VKQSGRYDLAQSLRAYSPTKPCRRSREQKSNTGGFDAA